MRIHHKERDLRGVELLLKYFPDLTEHQIRQFEALGKLYEEWNARINVISRRDMGEGSEGLYLRHILHSLAIARMCGFNEGARVMDVGTGGGFPAIPLAIMFPGAHFTAVDSIGKKIHVLSEVARGAGIENVTAVNGRAESIPGKFDYVVSRAVAPAGTVLGWVWPKIEQGKAGSIANGALLLKGGDLTEELAASGHCRVCRNIAEWFDEEFFETKKVAYFEK